MKIPLALVMLLIVASLLITPRTLFGGQDVLSEQRINGLKGLKEVALIERSSSKADEVIPTRDVFDHFILQTQRKLPELSVKKAEEAPAWVELSIIVAPHSAFAEISVYRWALIPSVKDQVVVKAWDASQAFVEGAITVAKMRDLIDTLLTKLALDYLTANKK
jgi:hypothetical protein